MSIAGDTPYYIECHHRDNGLIDYVLLNPHGWGRPEVKHVSPTGARDIEQMLGRIQNLVPPWQKEIEYIWVSAEALSKTIQDCTRKPP